MAICIKYSVARSVSGGPTPPPSSNSMVSLNSYFGIPEIPYGIASPPGVASIYTQSSTSHQLACIFPVIKTGTLEKIHMRYSVSTSSTVYELRVETVDSTGKPSGTLWGTDTSQSYSGVTANSTKTVTLSSGAVFNNIGELFALRHNITFFAGNASLQGYTDGSAGDFLPYLASTSNGGSSWTARTTAPSFALEYSDGSFVLYPGNYPIDSIATDALTTTSNPRMVGNAFNNPVKMRAVGMYINSDNDADFNIKLYDSDGTTVLASLSADADIPIGLTAGTTYVAYFPTPVELAANAEYYLMFESLGSTVTTYSLNMLANIPLSATNGGSIARYVSTTTNAPTGAGDFTISTSKQCIAGLIYDAVYTGA